MILATASDWVARANPIRPVIYGEKRFPPPPPAEKEPTEQTNEQTSGNETPVMNKCNTPCGTGMPHGESMCNYYIDNGFKQIYTEEEAGEYFDYDSLDADRIFDESVDAMTEISPQEARI